MRKIFLGFTLVLIIMISSCAQCNICVIDNTENDVCTNSVLDRAKAKSNCQKDGGKWSKIKE